MRFPYVAISMDRKTPRILIVYNADGGIVNALMHALHKQFAPGSYPCSLCALTYGPVSMHGQWRRFLDGLRQQVVFHHRDDFAAAYPGHAYVLPAILLAEGDSAPRTLIPAEDLDAMESLDELIVRLECQLEIERSRSPMVRVRA